MNFKFNISEDRKSYSELIRYNKENIPGVECLKPWYYLISFIIVNVLFLVVTIQFYSAMWFVFPIAIGSFLITSTISLFLLKGKYKRKKIKTKKKKTLNSNEDFIITIDEDSIIAENNNNVIKVDLLSVEKIDILKFGILLISKNTGVKIFIPIYILPISLDEFINLFKEKNDSLEIKEYVLNRRKERIKLDLLLSSTVIVCMAILICFLNYYYENNFITYDLITESNLEATSDNTYIYKNENLALEISFPKKWDGKYGIEEKDDKLNVYYLYNGVQSSKTRLLFTVVKENTFDEKEDFILIKTIKNEKGRYEVYSPSRIPALDSDSNYVEDYQKKYMGVYSLKIK